MRRLSVILTLYGTMAAKSPTTQAHETAITIISKFTISLYYRNDNIFFSFQKVTEKKERKSTFFLILQLSLKSDARFGRLVDIVGLATCGPFRLS